MIAALRATATFKPHREPAWRVMMPVMTDNRAKPATVEPGVDAATPGAGTPDAGTPDWAGLIGAVAVHRDKAAFALLFRHFAPRMKAFLMRAGTDVDVAQEVAQDAMISVWRKAASFDPARASASTWIFTIARNRRIDLLRRGASSRIEPEDYAIAFVEEPAPADRVAFAGQARVRLAGLMTTLAADQAEVVRMAFYEDKSHSAIAEELSLPLGTVKSRIRLALTRLRESLGGDYR